MQKTLSRMLSDSLQLQNYNSVRFFFLEMFEIKKDFENRAENSKKKKGASTLRAAAAFYLFIMCPRYEIFLQDLC